MVSEGGAAAFPVWSNAKIKSAMPVRLVTASPRTALFGISAALCKVADYK